MKIKVIFDRIDVEGVMGLEKVREYIKDNKVFQSNEACKRLLEQFDELVELTAIGNKGETDPAFFKKYEESFVGFWAAFDEAALSLGASPEFLRANMHNPALLSTVLDTKQMEELETLQQQELEEPVKSKKIKKLKSNNNRVRI